MISDPIRVDSSAFGVGLNNLGGDHVFYIYGTNSPAIGLASLTKGYDNASFGRPVTRHWAIEIWGPPINDIDYIINDDFSTKREQFMNHMIEHYPDHFEWLLFHPEWL